MYVLILCEHDVTVPCQAATFFLIGFFVVVVEIIELAKDYSDVQAINFFKMIIM